MKENKLKTNHPDTFRLDYKINKKYYSSETGLDVRSWNYDFYKSKGYQDKCEAQRNFLNWLVGFTDGDGCFNVYVNKDLKRVTFTYKISLRDYNIQALYYIKKELKCGRVSLADKNKMCHFRIRKAEHIEKIIIPLFNYICLKTQKNIDFLIFKHCFKLYKNKEDNYIEKIIKYKLSPPLMISKPRQKINKSWLVGFTEAEGSFYITKKSNNPPRLVHGFGITQKHDGPLLKEICLVLGIFTKVRWNNKGFWIIDVTKNSDIKKIKDYYFKCFKGVTSLYYRIWGRSFRDKGKYIKLLTIQRKLRKLRKP